MSRFVFITDLHFKEMSNTRTGDLLEDLLTKLKWVVDYCNREGAALLIGGDVFDKPAVKDSVKNAVIPELKRVTEGVYGISGNHDWLYGNPKFNYKTSYQTLVSADIIKDVDTYGDIDFGDCILTSTVPVLEKDKPCIVMFHGFLNIEDGRNTFRFTDIEPHQNKTLVLLGHDHKVYDDMQFDSKTCIVRPGSFQRCIRAEESNRCPQIVDITVNGNEISYIKKDIEVSRAYNVIFETKVSEISASEVHASYADVISQINNASKTQMTLNEALNMCGGSDVVSYMLKVLEEVKLSSNYKKQNL